MVAIRPILCIITMIVKLNYQLQPMAQDGQSKIFLVHNMALLITKLQSMIMENTYSIR